jgi:hypothetical protein
VAAISAGKGVWRREIPISGHFWGFARLKTRLLPTKRRSTFRRRAPAASALPLVLSRVYWVRPELVAEVKYLSHLLRQVVYEGLREETGGRRGSPAGAALTTLTASLNDQIGSIIVRRDSAFDNRPLGDRRTRAAHPGDALPGRLQSVGAANAIIAAIETVRPPSCTSAGIN